MFGFFLKKNFCNIWDNFFHTIFVNLPVILLSFLGYFFCSKMAGMREGTPFGGITFMIAVIICCLVWGILFLAEGENAARIANYDAPKFKLFLSQIPKCIKDGLLLGLCQAVLILAVLISIPYYFKIWMGVGETEGNLTGLLMMACVFWVVIIASLALQWVLPVRSLMHNNFRKCLKKSFILFFDNPFFSIGVALVNLFNTALAIFSMGILDGPATMAITSTNALKLRLYKYDWLEVNPGLTKAQRKHVPWDDLLVKEKRLLGKRSFRSLIYPWKE